MSLGLFEICLGCCGPPELPHKITLGLLKRGPHRWVGSSGGSWTSGLRRGGLCIERSSRELGQDSLATVMAGKTSRPSYAAGTVNHICISMRQTRAGGLYAWHLKKTDAS
jgi:hypothetical protein